MKIAILGWGSLIWDPGTLAYDLKEGWSTEGPFLPIEFARISNKNRLTLVITDEAKENLVKTLYAISSFDSIGPSIKNLTHRENTNFLDIGFYKKKNKQFFPSDFKYKEEIYQFNFNFNNQ